jgi:hypothetical protein
LGDATNFQPEGVPLDVPVSLGATVMPQLPAKKLMGEFAYG